jgi:DNA-binding transcriptional LysR family regulator
VHIDDKDLNLLSVFSALMTDRSVSRAASRLSLSQPAVSHALARLRRDFGDELFVRAAKGMTPTPRALALQDAVAAVLAQARGLYGSGETFSPKSADARVTIATTDYFEALLLPRLLPYLSREAPGVTLNCRPTPGDLPKAQLEGGEIDLAIAGFYGDLPQGYFKRVLFNETYACVVRKGHPRVKEDLTLATFASLEHVLVSPQGDLFGAVDHALQKKKMKRRVVAGVGNFHSPAAIVAATDYVVTVPKRLAKMYAETHPVKWFEPPLAVPGFAVVAVWHARTHRSPLHVWMRQAIEKLVG